MSPTYKPVPNCVGIMQPYFLPHLSYFQLIENTDIFCLHDKVKYTKQSWINRNRLVISGKIQYITLPIKSGSDFDLIDEKEISEIYNCDKILKTIRLNYKNSPNFGQVFPLAETILSYETSNLFEFLFHSINVISNYLDITTNIIRSSDTMYDQKLSSSEMVIDICKKLGSSEYINSEGGIELYSKSNFIEKGITLQFAKRAEFSYSNILGTTDSSLSMLDTLMWAERDDIIKNLSSLELRRI